MPELTQEELRRVLHYAPETGVFTRLIASLGRQDRIGHPIGRAAAKQHLQVSLHGRVYPASRLAWFYMTGEWPSEPVEHIDRNCRNNSWDNLRLISKERRDLTQRDLMRHAKYDPDTGLLTALIPRAHRPVGAILGVVTSNGYLGISLERGRYYVHRLIWLYMTGDWPPEHIDHINGIRTDNRWCNLRSASRSENNRNSARHRRNKSGRKGVFWDHKACQWRAKIMVNRQTHDLGLYDDLNEAGAAYVNAAKLYHREFARGE